ncbi:MFS transporter [Cupriavidus necator]|uniref:MFS transporter n=1 Tax=Cupriavidus necator TaxID=106590 RepID=UPI00339D7AE3
MRRVQSSKAAILVFLQGAMFWTASTAAIGFFPLLTVALQLSALEAGLFLAGAALGRTVFQPCAGLIIRPGNAGRYYVTGLGCCLVSSIVMACFHQASWVILARLAGGVGLSLFVVSWRTVLNRMAGLPCFDAVNESHVLSQNVGRLIGPALGGILVTCFGIQAAFIFPALLYSLCLLTSSLGQGPTQSESSRTEQVSLKFTTRIRDIRKQGGILLVHHVEFFCLGLWLAGWPICAVAGHRLSAEQLGYSFTIAAAGGLALFLVRPWTSKLSVQTRLILALTLLGAQPGAALLTSDWSLLLCLSFLVGGLGGSIYFTSFHRLLADTYSPEQIPFIYGMLGSSTFLCQAIGQAITPFLSGYLSPKAPIILDAVMLLGCFIFLALNFLVAWLRMSR